MLIWLSGLSAIPVEIYDAAKVDGAGRFTQIWKITLPNIKRPFFIVAMLSVVNSLKIFREQYLMAGGYPDMTIYQIQHIFNNWFEKLEISKLTAGAVLTALVFFGVILIIRCVCLTDWYGMRLKIRRRFLLRRPKQQERGEGRGSSQNGRRACGNVAAGKAGAVPAAHESHHRQCHRTGYASE